MLRRGRDSYVEVENEAFVICHFFSLCSPFFQNEIHVFLFWWAMEMEIEKARIHSQIPKPFFSLLVEKSIMIVWLMNDTMTVRL
jgi:hypothetical protein